MRLAKQAQLPRFEVNQIHGISVVNVSGELSRYNMRSLEKVFNSFLDRGQLSIVLNFSGLDHIDYRLVRRLADHIICFQCEGGDIKIASASSYIQQILRVMGMEEDQICSSVEDAVMGFFSQEPEGGVLQ